ncbi:hypothetical protein [Candidatus Blastococcus massiliensis]|uniref:hypothetical protein n=1 Tax=Candidatus Blastococcus massiliensis TaxID=1470358 RepID=UPI0004B67D05|nr:hypothetical protein [Candidatus Blastococcus massiliensis]
MDVPAAAAGPWIALGAVLGILLLLAVGAVLLRLRGDGGAAAPQAPPPEARDDLAHFLEHPPGTPGATVDDGEGWASLYAAPPVGRGAPDAAPSASGARPGAVLTGFAIAALLLVGTAAALATARSPERPAASDTAAPAAPSGADPSSAPPAPDGVAARLFFGGVVLEEHAVGVTAAFPELELSWDDERAQAHLRLPTANCLAAEAPAAAGDPACRPGRTEYADLTAPGLRVDRDGETLRISGRFATYLRPPGRSAEPTGRSYELTVTATPSVDEDSGWLPAEAELRWDDRTVVARAEDRPSALRYGG